MCVVNVAEVPTECCVVMLISPGWVPPKCDLLHGHVCRGCWVPFSTGPEGHDHEAELESSGCLENMARQKYARRSPEQTPGSFKHLPVYINSSFPPQTRKLRNTETTSPSGFHATAL